MRNPHDTPEKERYGSDVRHPHGAPVVPAPKPPAVPEPRKTVELPWSPEELAAKRAQAAEPEPPKDESRASRESGAPSESDHTKSTDATGGVSSAQGGRGSRRMTVELPWSPEELAAKRAQAAEPEPVCTVHGDVAHGGEAEELRAGLEELIRNDDVRCSTVLALIDRVDARDSLVFSERQAAEPSPAAWDIRGKEPVLVAAPAAESEPDVHYLKRELNRASLGEGVLRTRIVELEAALAYVHKLTGRGEGHGSTKATVDCIVDSIVSRSADMHESESELCTANGRIAELEAANKSLAEMTLGCQTSIAQAVAELESNSPAVERAERALELLRGSRT